MAKIGNFEIDTIYNEDCLEGMKRIPDKSIDLIVTDPPYILENQGGGFFNDSNYGYHGNSRHVMKDIAEMKDGINDAILDELCRISKKINMYFFCSQRQIPLYLDYFVAERGCNWNLLCWHKTDPIPACGNKYLNDTEYCLFFREKGVPLFGSFDTKGTYWVTPLNRADKEKWGHPTIKPLPIIQMLIINSSKEGQIVLDPFMGSGTTALASVKEKRHYIGFELNKEYWEKSCNRIKFEQAQLSLF